MRDFLTLTKANIINSLRLNNIFKKNKDGQKSLIMASLIIILGIFVFLLLFFQMFMYGEIFSAAGFPQMVLIVGIILGTALTLIANISQVEGYLYKSRDFDLLMALPLKRNTIVASKMTSLLIINYASFGLVFIPSVVSYGFYNPVTAAFVITAIISFFLLPLLPIVISGVIFYLLGFIQINPKVKQIFVLILSIAFFVGIMIGSMSISSVETLGTNIENVVNTIKKIYYPGYLSYMASQGSYLSLLWFSLMSIIPFVVFCLVIAKNYVGINNRHKLVYTNKNFKLTERKESSRFAALFKREVKRYFGSMNYCLNTIVGPILSTVFILIFYFNIKDTGFIETGFDVGIIMMVMIAFTNGMIPTTTAAISLEGKNFWILKTAPVSTKEVFNSKLALNMIISVPFIIINVIIGIVLLKLEIVTALFILVIGILYCILASVLGLYVNLCNPNLNWTHEIKVIKQSTSTFITMFSSMGITAVIGIPSLIMISKGTIDTIFIYLYVTVILIILLGIFGKLLFSNGVKRYQKLEC